MIRLLRFGHTLRWLPDEDDDPQGPGAWYIDLTARSSRHKTTCVVEGIAESEAMTRSTRRD